MRCAAVLLVLGLCIGGTRGLYFHISETETKCFIEEVPAETMIVGGFLISATPRGSLILFLSAGKYKTQLYDEGRQTWLPSSPGIGMHVEVCNNLLC